MPYERFTQINISNHLYPCVDELSVETSSLPRTDFELVGATTYKEFYSESSGVLNAIGYNGRDPFLNSPNNFIQYFKDIPIARANRKDDFSSDVTTQFFISYNLQELPSSLRDWAKRENVTEIKVLAELEWEVEYNKQDEFHLLDVIYGFSTKNKQVFRVVEMDLKKNKWTKVTWQGISVLRDNFGEKVLNFQSFYPYQTNVEMARIYSSLPHKFYFQLGEPIGEYSNCRHKSNDIYVYPNPTFGDIKVKFNGAQESEFKFELFNIIGKPVWSTTFKINSPDQIIDLQMLDLEKGIYLYAVSNLEGKRLRTQRLIIIEP